MHPAARRAIRVMSVAVVRCLGGSVCPMTARDTRVARAVIGVTADRRRICHWSSTDVVQGTTGQHLSLDRLDGCFGEPRRVMLNSLKKRTASETRVSLTVRGAATRSESLRHSSVGDPPPPLVFIHDKG